MTPLALRRGLLTLVALAIQGCASTSLPVNLPPVETREDLVDALDTLGYDLQPIAGRLFLGSPTPAAGYRVTQRDGRAFTILAFEPQDYELLQNNTALDFRPRAGLTEGSEWLHRSPAGNTPARLRPQLFRKGSVVILFGEQRSDLFYDLEQLLGRPTY